MVRRIHRDVPAMVALAELATLAPFVAAQRTLRASAMPASSALREWSLWGVEKIFVWQQAAWRAWASALTGARPGVAVTARILRPVSARVKRNARKLKR